MMQPAVWTPGYAALMFAMWWVMMAAMMLPSAAPMLLLFARVTPGRARWRCAHTCRPAFSLLGYLVAWGGFSALATACNGVCSGSVCCRR